MTVRVSRLKLGILPITAFVALGSWLASTTFAQEGIIVITVTRPEPLGAGPKDEMVERLGQKLIEELKRELGKALPPSTYRVLQEEEAFQEGSSGSLVQDQAIQHSYRLSVHYKKEPERYVLFSDLFEGEERAQATVSNYRLCPSDSDIECSLSQIVSFHIPHILRNTKPKAKQYFLELEYQAYGGNLSQEAQKAETARGQRTLEILLNQLLHKSGWNHVGAACYADYIFRVQASAFDKDLRIKVTVHDANSANSPWKEVYEPDDSQSLEDFMKLDSKDADQWVANFVRWLGRQRSGLQRAK